ncbi:serine protease [Kitasatospora sp. NPDC094015]|uniref:trypsin-like serine peptidase n=1 Tax=Kitasatospora sp. NPDC094015 TaxID=3155205 RepID=UPI0033243AB6
MDRRGGKRRRVRRPVAMTSLLVLGLAGAVAGVGTLAPQIAAARRPADPAAVAGPAAPSGSPQATADPSAEASAAPSATTSADASDGADAQSARSVTVPTVGSGHQGEKATMYHGDGTTDTAVAGAEPDRVGALFSGAVTAGNHDCTASVIHSDTKDLVLTAAHCVSGAAGLRFAPGYRDGKAPYGSWQVTAVFTTDGWRQDGDQDEDFAILRVAPLGGRSIEDVVGGNPLGLDASGTAKVRLYGYPDGSEEPILCINDTTRRSSTQRRIDCPSFPGGTSGGPWIDTTDGEVIGVIGGYQQGGDTDDTSYSATFGKTVADLYQQALKAAG